MIFWIGGSGSVAVLVSGVLCLFVWFFAILCVVIWFCEFLAAAWSFVLLVFGDFWCFAGYSFCFDSLLVFDCWFLRTGIVFFGGWMFSRWLPFVSYIFGICFQFQKSGFFLGGNFIFWKKKLSFSLCIF